LKDERIKRFKPMPQRFRDIFWHISTSPWPDNIIFETIKAFAG